MRLGADSADKRQALGIPYGLNCQIDVQLWPIEVIRRRQLDAKNLSNRDATEPRKLGEWKE